MLTNLERKPKQYFYQYPKSAEEYLSYLNERYEKILADYPDEQNDASQTTIARLPGAREWQLANIYFDLKRAYSTIYKLNKSENEELHDKFNKLWEKLFRDLSAFYKTPESSELNINEFNALFSMDIARNVAVESEGEKNVHRLDNENNEKETFRIHFTNGKVKDFYDHTVTTTKNKPGELHEYIFVIGFYDGSIYFNSKSAHQKACLSDELKFNHSSFLSGQPVICGGTLAIDKEGKITEITNKSGHYKPDSRQMLLAVQQLYESGADLNNTKVTIINDKNEEMTCDALLFLQANYSKALCNQSIAQAWQAFRTFRKDDMEIAKYTGPYQLEFRDLKYENLEELIDRTKQQIDLLQVSAQEKTYRQQAMIDVLAEKFLDEKDSILAHAKRLNISTEFITTRPIPPPVPTFEHNWDEEVEKIKEFLKFQEQQLDNNKNGKHYESKKTFLKFALDELNDNKKLPEDRLSNFIKEGYRKARKHENDEFYQLFGSHKLFIEAENYAIQKYHMEHPPFPSIQPTTKSVVSEKTSSIDIIKELNEKIIAKEIKKPIDKLLFLIQDPFILDVIIDAGVAIGSPEILEFIQDYQKYINITDSDAQTKNSEYQKINKNYIDNNKINIDFAIRDPLIKLNGHFNFEKSKVALENAANACAWFLFNPTENTSDLLWEVNGTFPNLETVCQCSQLLPPTITDLSQLKQFPSDHLPLVTKYPVAQEKEQTFGFNTLTYNVLSKNGPSGYDIQDDIFNIAIEGLPKPPTINLGIRYIDLDPNLSENYEKTLKDYEDSYKLAIKKYDDFITNFQENLQNLFATEPLNNDDLSKYKEILLEIKNQYNKDEKILEYFAYEKKFSQLKERVGKKEIAIPPDRTNDIEQRSKYLDKLSEQQQKYNKDQFKDLITDKMQEIRSKKNAELILTIVQNPDSAPLGLITLQESSPEVDQAIQNKLGSDWKILSSTTQAGVTTFYNINYLKPYENKPSVTANSYRVDYFRSIPDDKPIACSNMHLPFEREKSHEEYNTTLRQILGLMHGFQGVIAGDPNVNVGSHCNDTVKCGVSLIPPTLRGASPDIYYRYDDIVYEVTETGKIVLPPQTPLTFENKIANIPELYTIGKEQKIYPPLPADFLDQLNQQTLIQRFINRIVQAKQLDQKHFLRFKESVISECLSTEAQNEKQFLSTQSIVGELDPQYQLLATFLSENIKPEVLEIIASPAAQIINNKQHTKAYIKATKALMDAVNITKSGKSFTFDSKSAKNVKNTLSNINIEPSVDQSKKLSPHQPSLTQTILPVQNIPLKGAFSPNPPLNRPSYDVPPQVSDPVQIPISHSENSEKEKSVTQLEKARTRFHPALPRAMRAKDENGSYNEEYQEVRSDHVPILAAIPFPENPDESFQEVKIISWNVLDFDDSNGFSPDPNKICGEEPTQRTKRYQEIAKSLKAMVDSNQPHLIALQEINLSYEGKELFGYISEMLGKDWGFCIQNNKIDDRKGCITLFNTNFFTEGSSVDIPKKTPLVVNTNSFKVKKSSKDLVVYNSHSDFALSPVYHQEKIEEILATGTPDKKVIMVGDLNTVTLPIQEQLTNNTTSVSPAGFRNPITLQDREGRKPEAMQQGGRAIDGCYYSDCVGVEPKAEQALTQHLNPQNGQIYSDEELLACFNDLPKTQEQEVDSLEMGICIGSRFSRPAIAGISIFDYETYLRRELCAPKIFVREASNLKNQRGIAIQVPDSLYNYLKNKNLAYLDNFSADEPAADGKIRQVLCFYKDADALTHEIENYIKEQKRLQNIERFIKRVIVAKQNDVWYKTKGTIIEECISSENKKNIEPKEFLSRKKSVIKGLQTDLKNIEKQINHPERYKNIEALINKIDNIQMSYDLKDYKVINDTLAEVVKALPSSLSSPEHALIDKIIHSIDSLKKEVTQLELNKIKKNLNDTQPNINSTTNLYNNLLKFLNKDEDQNTLSVLGGPPKNIIDFMEAYTEAVKVIFDTIEISDKEPIKILEFDSKKAIENWDNIPFKKEDPTRNDELNKPENWGLIQKIISAHPTKDHLLNDNEIQIILNDLPETPKVYKLISKKDNIVDCLELEKANHGVRTEPYSIYIVLNDSTAARGLGSHWISTKITVTPGESIDIEYANSLRASGKPDVLIDAVKNVYKIEPKHKEKKETIKQNHYWECGYLSLFQIFRELAPKSTIASWDGKNIFTLRNIIQKRILQKTELDSKHRHIQEIKDDPSKMRIDRPDKYKFTEDFIHQRLSLGPTHPSLLDKIDPKYDYDFDFSSFFGNEFDLRNIRIIQKKEVNHNQHEERVHMAEMLLQLQKLAQSDPAKVAELNQQIKRYLFTDLSLETEDELTTATDDSSVYDNDCLVRVEKKDCVEVAKKLENYFSGKVVLLNMANDEHVLGGVFRGARAQEEHLARVTGLAVSLLKYAQEHQGWFDGERPCYHPNSYGQTDVLYSKNTVFRTPKFEEQEPSSINMITSASLIKSDDQNFYYDKEGKYNLETGRAIQMAKIYNQIAVAIKEGNKAIVLSAFGCGAFHNNPKEMAKLYREILSLPEFIGKIRIHFAVIKGEPPNFPPFYNEFFDPQDKPIPLTMHEAEKSKNIRAPIIAIQEFEKMTSGLRYLIYPEVKSKDRFYQLREKIRNECVSNASSSQFISDLKHNMEPVLKQICDNPNQLENISNAEIILDLMVYQNTKDESNKVGSIIPKLNALIRDPNYKERLTSEEIGLIKNDEKIMSILGHNPSLIQRIKSAPIASSHKENEKPNLREPVFQKEIQSPMTLKEDLQIDRFLRRMIQARLVPSFGEIIQNELDTISEKTKKNYQGDVEKYITKKAFRIIGKYNFNQLKKQFIHWLNNQSPNQNKDVLTLGLEASSFKNLELLQDSFKKFSDVFDSCIIMNKSIDSVSFRIENNLGEKLNEFFKLWSDKPREDQSVSTLPKVELLKGSSADNTSDKIPAHETLSQPNISHKNELDNHLTQLSEVKKTISPTTKDEDEVFVEKQPVAKRPVALLDVDHTLLFHDQINNNLLDSLLANGIKDVYLFTDMTLNGPDIVDRKKLIETLESKGFNVHGVITTNDMYWQQLAGIDDAELEIINNNLLLLAENYGKEGGDDVLNEFWKSCPNIKKILDSTIIGNPSEAFNTVLQENLNLDDEESMYHTKLKSTVAKLLTQLKQEGAAKGQMMEIFLSNMPEWADGIIVADDKIEEIYAVTSVIKNKNLAIPTTLIHIPVMQSAEDYGREHYDQFTRPYNQTVTHCNNIASLLREKLIEKHDRVRILQECLSPKILQPNAQLSDFAIELKEKFPESFEYIPNYIKFEGEELGRRLLKTFENIGSPNKDNILIYYKIILDTTKKFIESILIDIGQDQDPTIINELCEALAKELIQKANRTAEEKGNLSSGSLKVGILNAMNTGALRTANIEKVSFLTSLESPQSALSTVVQDALRQNGKGKCALFLKEFLGSNDELTIEQLNQFEKFVNEPSDEDTAKVEYYSNLNQFCNNLANYEATISNKRKQQFYDKMINLRDDIKNVVKNTEGGLDSMSFEKLTHLNNILKNSSVLIRDPNINPSNKETKKSKENLINLFNAEPNIVSITVEELNGIKNLDGSINIVENPSEKDSAIAQYYSNLRQFHINLVKYKNTIYFSDEKQKFYEKGVMLEEDIKKAVATMGGIDSLDLQTITYLNEVLKKSNVLLRDPNIDINNKDTRTSIDNMFKLSQEIPGTASIPLKSVGAGLLAFAFASLVIVGLLLAIPTGPLGIAAAALGVAGLIGLAVAGGVSAGLAGTALFYGREKGLAKSEVGKELAKSTTEFANTAHYFKETINEIKDASIKEVNEPLQKQLLGELKQIKESPSSPGLGVDGIKIILHQHNSSNLDKNQIKLVDRDNVVDLIKETIKNHNESKHNRYQFIVKTANHYSVVDLNIDINGKVKVLVLDAANDPRYLPLAMDLSKINGVENVYFAAAESNKFNIQKDLVSCPVFALSHALALQSLEIYSHIETDNTVKDFTSEKLTAISWNYMPPELTINSQSSTVWNKYKEVYQKSFGVDDSYRAKMHERSSELNPSCKDAKENIIPSVFEDLTHSAINYVLKTNDAELKKVISENTADEYNPAFEFK